MTTNQALQRMGQDILEVIEDSGVRRAPREAICTALTARGANLALFDTSMKILIGKGFVSLAGDSHAITSLGGALLQMIRLELTD